MLHYNTAVFFKKCKTFILKIALFGTYLGKNKAMPKIKFNFFWI